MKPFFLAFLFSLIATLSHAQEEFTLNQEAPVKKTTIPKLNMKIYDGLRL